MSVRPRKSFTAICLFAGAFAFYWPGNYAEADPLASITYPSTGQTVSGTIFIAGTAQASLGVAVNSVSIDGNPYKLALGTTTWLYALKTDLLSNGSHTLVAEVRDTQGNVATAPAVGFTVLNPGPAGPVLITGPTQNWCAAINSATPGTTVVLASGTYTQPCAISVSGTAAAPITIRSAGPDPTLRAVMAYNGTTSNLIDSYGSYLVIRWLTFGPSQIYVDAYKIQSGHDLVIEDNLFQGLGGFGIPDNSANTSRIAIMDNTTQEIGGIEGDSFYIGCQDGNACRASYVFIERNFINGINPQDTADVGYGMEVKLNSYALIRENTVYNTKGPGIMVYGSSVTANPSDIVEGNYVQGAVNDAGINAGGGPAVIRNNITIANGFGGIRGQNYAGRNLQQNVWIVNNTVINNQGGGIIVQSWNAGAGNVMAYNGIVPLSGTSAISPSAPVGTIVGNIACASASSCFDQGSSPPYDLWPVAAGPLIGVAGTGTEPWRVTDDFMCLSRGSPADGAAFQRTGSGSGPPIGGGSPRPPCVSGATGTSTEPPARPQGLKIQ